MLKIIFTLLFATLFVSCNAQRIDRTTVETLDISRFLGHWYEVARLDTRFERDLINVTAYYSLEEDGSIKVTNRGYNTRKERWGESIAKATFTTTPGRLRVSFVPLIASDYNILLIDDEYQWALIGSSSPDYLWILSRSSQMQDSTLKRIISVAEARGYNLDKLLVF